MLSLYCCRFLFQKYYIITKWTSIPRAVSVSHECHRMPTACTIHFSAPLLLLRSSLTKRSKIFTASSFLSSVKFGHLSAINRSSGVLNIANHSIRHIKNQQRYICLSMLHLHVIKNLLMLFHVSHIDQFDAYPYVVFTCNFLVKVS